MCLSTVGVLSRGAGRSELGRHTIWIGYDSHAIKFDRVAFTLVNVPLLNQSTSSASPSVGEPGSLLTYTLRVRNTGVIESVVNAPIDTDPPDDYNTL